MTRLGIRALLAGGDRRSVGRVSEVLGLVRHQPHRTAQLVAALGDPDPIVRMRAADALEKASVHRPEVLRPHKRVLLTLARRTTQQELRWHLAQLIPRLHLTAREREGLMTLFQAYSRDGSAIVRTFAMQALADLAARDTRLRARVLRLLGRLTSTGTPAMRARGRRLLATLRAAKPGS